MPIGDEPRKHLNCLFLLTSNLQEIKTMALTWNDITGKVNKHVIPRLVDNVRLTGVMKCSVIQGIPSVDIAL